MEACPQYTKQDIARYPGESDADFSKREDAAYDQSFVGPAVISQTVLFNSHPSGKMSASSRLEALMGPGGITDCGNAQNCVKVCPKEIPLTRSIARAGRETSIYSIMRWLSK